MTDELEALFDQISDEQREQTDVGGLSPEPSSEDELEALFDELSAETQAEAVTGAESTEDELEALFDELSSAKSEEQTATTEVTHPEAVVVESDPDLSEDMSDLPLYDRVGGILRRLHDSMRELGYDRALQDVATEFIDAKGRLEYVATLTEQAATRVLNSIDTSLPQQEELAKKARDLDERWTALFDGNMDVDAFKQLAQDSRNFATNTALQADEERARLMEIMMAQDFQDITGQIIKKVVVITQKLQQELAQILRDNAPPETKEKAVDLLAGPDVPDKAMDQDDVDSLLANLGF